MRLGFGGVFGALLAHSAGSLASHRSTRVDASAVSARKEPPFVCPLKTVFPISASKTTGELGETTDQLRVSVLNGEC